jgi:hypothetical protein
MINANKKRESTTAIAPLWSNLPDLSWRAVVGQFICPGDLWK